MKHVFVVSPTVKDADGVLGLIYAMAHTAIPAERLHIHYVQLTYEGHEDKLNNFHELYARFRNTIPEAYRCEVVHNAVSVLPTPSGSVDLVSGVAATITEHRGSVCVFIDLGTAYENRETTALYHALRHAHMEDKCILYAPSPDSEICRRWKSENQCKDFIVRREDVTRARAIYVPLRTRFCKALEIAENI